VKLVTFTHDGSPPRSGALIDDGITVVDLFHASASMVSSGVEDARLASVQAMIDAGDGALDAAYSAVSVARPSAKLRAADIMLQAPVPLPIQMRDCLCFEGHLLAAFPNLRRIYADQFDDPAEKLAEFERKGTLTVPQVFYEQPMYYKANRFSVIGAGQDVIWPHYSKLLDFELEFGVYIKNRCKDVSVATARDHIFGYTIFNDFTARDAQIGEMGGLGPAKAKDFDTANAMGPCLVTADELTDPYNLRMVARVNGEEWTRANSRSMHWSFEQVIAHVTRSETLYPGEFLGSGTVEGGCGLELMRFLSPGDVVELEIEGIGTLRNRLVMPGSSV
jgi:2-keto-4-pentenoate hydratase/2-oxohepta-3-ene-1,7-dioic acid hydratase in catechol pathway